MSFILSNLVNVAGNVTGILPVLNGGTGVSTSTGTTNTVLSNSPTLVTPTLGAATATSINKMAITAPATSSTLAVADGKTFAVSNSLTLAGTDGNTMTFPSGSSTVMTLGSTDSKTGNITMSSSFVIASGTGSGVAIEIARASPSSSDTQNIYSGTYTPTLVGGGTGTITAGGAWRWYRTGNMVTVFGYATTPSGFVASVIDWTLPITPAAFSATFSIAACQLQGTLFQNDLHVQIAGNSGDTKGVTVNNVTMPGTTALYFHFSYSLT